MYCKHCGKEIADDSIFCQHCGGKQKEESVRSSRWNGFITRHKKQSYSYLIWFAINIAALAYGMGNPNRVRTTKGPIFDNQPIDIEINTSAFYPFESYDIGNYDFSEFIVYTVAIPLCLFAIIKLVKSFKRNK